MTDSAPHIEALAAAVDAVLGDRVCRETSLPDALVMSTTPEQLVEVARTLRANVNLIRYNEVKGIEFQRPRDEDVRQFQEVLRKAFVNVHIRASRGRDIAAACGQLRHEKQTA